MLTTSPGDGVGRASTARARRWDRTRMAIPAVAERVAALLRSAPDGDAPIPRSEWTVAETAAHLIIGAQRCADRVSGVDGPPIDAGDLPAWNARLIRQLPERQVGALAELLLAAERAYVAALAARSGTERVRWLQGIPLTLAADAGRHLGELLVHGLDMARALREPWPIAPDHARLVLAALPATMPWFVDERAARGVRASYELRVRGGPRFVCRFADGRLAIETPGGHPVDCVITVDPVAFLLAAYGRASPWGPILRGQMLAWGRRPWLAFRFKRLMRSP